MDSSSVQGKLTGFGYKKMKQEGEEQRKMRPSIPQWWRIDSYFHLLVLKLFPNVQASWWLFPRQGLMLLWHTGTGLPKWDLHSRDWEGRGAVWGIKVESAKAGTAAGAAWLGEDQGCSFMPGLGPSETAALAILWSLIAETTAGSSHSKATIHLQTVWGRGCFLSAAIWASSIGSRLWTHSVGRRAVYSVPLVGFLCQTMG